MDYQDYESKASEYTDLMADNKIHEFSELDIKMSADILKDIKDSGDIDLSGSVTTDDADMLNGILSNTWTQDVTDEQLLMLDTFDDTNHKYVYTSDVNDILKKAAEN